MSVILQTHAGDETAVRRISTELDSFFARKLHLAKAHGAHFVTLWQVASERMRGGKLIRPLMFLQMLDALSPEADHVDFSRRPELVRLAASLELLHFSFLLHDDVIDGDVLRRGRPNFIGAILADHAKTDSNHLADAVHFARSCAILMGDLLLSEVHQAFARADIGAHARTKVLDLLECAITETVAGELIDVGLSDGMVSPELSTILEMCRLKTATYSFELPLRLAAVLSGTSPSVESALAKAGRHLGLAYQLHDDVLSTFGDAAQHGKDAFSDLREGKETAVIAYARMTSTWGSIEPYFGSPSLNEARGIELRRVLLECGSHSYVSSLIDDELCAFEKLLDHDSTGLPDRATAALRSLATEIATRTS